MGNSSIPIQLTPALIAECRHDLAQFRMHSATVVTLVIVFHDYLPVCLNVVGDLHGSAKVTEWIALHSRDDLTQLLLQRAAFFRCFAGRQIQKEEASPRFQTNWM